MNCLSSQNLQNQSDQSSSSHVKEKVESNKKTKDGLSSQSKLTKSITHGTNNIVPVMEPLLSGSENDSNIKAKVILEEQARNRGDAMLRYKEKKKTRRYISLNIRNLEANANEYIQKPIQAFTHNRMIGRPTITNVI